MPPSNLPTPRTDARISHVDNGVEYVNALFTRELERESSTHLQTIGALNAQLADEAGLVLKLDTQLRRLTERNDALRAALAETVTMYEGKADQALTMRDTVKESGTPGVARRARHEGIANAFRSVAQHLKGLLA